MAEPKRTEYYPKNRKEWRSWLQRNHIASRGVWVIFYKKNSGRPTISYDEAVEEALCFGWIDSKPNKRDEESYFRFISPRKPKSAWSSLNKKRIERLVKNKKMTKAGRQKIELAKKNGAWSSLDKVEALEMPVDLKRGFSKNKTGLKNFELFPPSTKKQIYYWIESARTSVTRQKRITETITLAEQNIRANQWKPV